MKRDVFQTALNAMSNASTVPVSEADVIAVITTGDGPGNLVRALFGDCAHETLERIAARAGRTPSQLIDAYCVAKRKHAAANPEIEMVEIDAGKTAGP